MPSARAAHPAADAGGGMSSGGPGVAQHDVDFVLGRPVERLVFEAGFERVDHVIDQALGCLVVVDDANRRSGLAQCRTSCRDSAGKRILTSGKRGTAVGYLHTPFSQ
jgi:hypothetical protein